MAKKDVEQYFNKICDDYKEMKDTLQEMGELLEMNVISPEKYDSLKATVENMKVNYMRISYIMYLLNYPKNKKKHKMYDKMVKKPTEGTLEEVSSENKSYINELKEMIK